MELGPDGRDEPLFRPLDESDPELAEFVRQRFATTWLAESGFPASRFAEALETVEVRVAPDDEPGTRLLRITSTFTGSTRWLYSWRGDPEEALAFADEAARDEAAWVHDDRRLHGPTEWD